MSVGFPFNVGVTLILPFVEIGLFIRRIMGALVNGDPAMQLRYDVDSSQLNDGPWQITLISVLCHFLDGSPVDLQSAAIATALSISDQASKSNKECLSLSSGIFQHYCFICFNVLFPQSTIIGKPCFIHGRVSPGRH